jgi:hypothetical protein
MWNEITLIVNQIKMFIDIYLNETSKFDLVVHVGETDFLFSLTRRGYQIHMFRSFV